MRWRSCRGVATIRCCAQKRVCLHVEWFAASSLNNENRCIVRRS